MQPKSPAVGTAAQGVLFPGDGSQTNTAETPQLGKAASSATDLPTWRPLFWINTHVRMSAWNLPAQEHFAVTSLLRHCRGQGQTSEIRQPSRAFRPFIRQRSTRFRLTSITTTQAVWNCEGLQDLRPNAAELLTFVHRFALTNFPEPVPFLDGLQFEDVRLVPAE